MEFNDVVAGYYNALRDGFGLSGSQVQLLQPTIIPPDTTSLWSLLDQIPPMSLHRDSGKPLSQNFLSAIYIKILESIQIPSRNRFHEAVGQEVADRFIQYLSERSENLPAVNAYPALFRSWALMNSPAVAMRGVTALTGMLLEPLSAAFMALLAYKNRLADASQPGRLPDWDITYDELVTSLKFSPSREFSVSTATADSNIMDTWTSGLLGSRFGLWRSSGPESEQAEKFASSDFRIHVSSSHVQLFRPIPGKWYSSAALNIAYANSESPPWSSASSLNWETCFGRQGILRNVTTGLIVASSFKATIESFGPYNEEDQQTILNNHSKGLWPLYMAAGVEAICSFDQNGSLVIDISADPQAPVIIGVVLESIENYLGRDPHS